MAKKMVLGKGMASLLQSNQIESNHKVNASDDWQKMNQYEEEASPFEMSKKEENFFKEGEILLVDQSAIIENPFQPRKVFDEKNLLELSQSIKENGILQPLVVTQNGNKFELIAGERRLRAARLAQLEKIPVIIKRSTERDKLILAILENIQRENLNCVDEAIAYERLMHEFQLSQEEVAKRLGKERSSIANHVRLLKMPSKVLNKLSSGEITFGHGKILASIKDHDKLIELVDLIIQEKFSVKDLQSYLDESADKDKKNKNLKGNEKVKEEKETLSGPLKDKINFLRKSIEEKTGFHVNINIKENGSGDISFKFNEVPEFNQIYDYLINKRVK